MDTGLDGSLGAALGEWWQGSGADWAALHPGGRWRRLGEVRGGGGGMDMSAVGLPPHPWSLRPTPGPSQLRWCGGRKGGLILVLGGGRVGSRLAVGGRVGTRRRMTTGLRVMNGRGVTARRGVSPG